MPMRRLRTCEFCGDDATGVYEALPPELSPTEAEQRRLVLCADCAERIDAVVAPLLRRLGVEPDGESEPADGRTAPADGKATPAGTAHGRPSPAETEPASRDTRTDDTPDSDGVPAGRDGPAEAGGSVGNRDDGRRPGLEGPSGTDERDETVDGEDDVAGGTTPEDGRVDDVRSEPSGQSDPEGRRDPGGGAVDAEGSAAETSDADPMPGAGSGPGSVTADRGDDGDEPEEFRTVMRLLGNREFPVERDAVVEVAASAYGLDDAHVSRCLEYAVDRGVLDADGGRLYRG